MVLRDLICISPACHSRSPSNLFGGLGDQAEAGSYKLPLILLLLLITLEKERERKEEKKTSRDTMNSSSSGSAPKHVEQASN